ncbi:MAG: undecaprenyl-diphosphate phosphatase [Planctomycetes bacterium]|nr:undecaprenyl-diphosphate phosphatase [Planctomycetota bacterium]
MMETQDAIVLGMIQGLTEFLPVSSSGHLVLAGALLGAHSEGAGEADFVAFEILLHLGSLCAIAIVFGRDILRLLFPRIDFHGLKLLFIASLPAAIIGITIKKLLPDASSAWLETHVLSSPYVAACGLLLTASVLWLAGARRDAEVTFENARGPRLWTVFWVGCAQAVAILPGVSRSGSTIATALNLKWVRPEAVKLSFLMGFIAIGGAGLIEARNIGALAQANPLPMIAGFVSSLVFSIIGLTAIKLIVNKGKLRYFAVYCAVAGVTALAWLALR